MNLKELKIRHEQGSNISFSICDHPRIPNTVLIDGAIAGTVSKQTIEAFRKFITTK